MRIIAPITLAHDSVEAAAVAARYAGEMHAELVLAGISPLATFEAGHQRLVDRLVSERLSEVAGALDPDVRARTVLTWGSVGAALVATARDEDADLVVIPIRKESELAHLLHDHADRYVLHHSDVPVMVVPTNGSVV